MKWQDHGKHKRKEKSNKMKFKAAILDNKYVHAPDDVNILQKKKKKK